MLEVVGLDGGVEEDRFLTDITNLLSIVSQIDCLQILAVNQNLTFCRVIESLNKLDCSALTRS